jgi:phosphoribosyl-ATP pyrophosphohydrolase/phosphoribosyl-AMP cyclohydrolase
MHLRPDSSGLLPAIVQDRLTGEVRSLGWITADAVVHAAEHGRAELHDGNAVVVERVIVDREARAVLLLTHANEPTSFASSVGLDGAITADSAPAEPFAFELARTIGERRRSTATQSYTKSLLDAGAAKIGDKLREEAGELADAVAGESDERVASEAGDLLYHLLVALELRGVPLERVIEVLAGRSGTSGHDEKAARPPTKGS